MKTTVIHHSADFDGLFCREIARKFLPDAELIGWDFGDAPLEIPSGPIYVMDLPIDRVFGFDYSKVGNNRGPQHPPGLVWIDHHKSSIESHPADIPGYRIDGVAACRLAWQWFSMSLGEILNSRHGNLPNRQEFIDRKVSEPLAVRLAGEYDIWDKRDPDAEVFQFGLRSVDMGADLWEALLQTDGVGRKAVQELMENGYLLQRYQKQNDASIVNHRSFLVEFEGLKFLALNTARCNSLTFAAKDVPETGHDALMGFYYDGTKWNVSLYHAKHRTDIDLSVIAVKHGGGGHRGACGFITPFPVWMLPFVRDGKLPPTTADARVWTRTWEETLLKHPTIPHDEGAMIAWFANAIMAGYDEKTRQCATKS